MNLHFLDIASSLSIRSLFNVSGTIPSLVVFEIHSSPFHITYGVVDTNFIETLFSQ